MPSPRTLRSSSAFTPKSVPGLALWLDASRTGDLYTTDAGPVTAVSSPTEISGCLCWYDAADTSSITKDGSNLVSQWNDKSGNARHATASGSLRPTHGGSQNGNTVMQFTGTQAMSITGNFLQSENVTLFAVAMKNTNHYGGIITSAPSNPEDSPLLGFYSTTIALVNRRQVVQQALANGVYGIVCGQANGTSQQGWFNGVKGTDSVASAAPNTAGTITKIGAFRTSDAADLNGNIAEIICYSGNLSTTDRARVEAYLAAKWGIAGVHAAATSASDPVGYWKDRSGSGRNVTNATSTKRPTVASENGRKALAFDGTDDNLNATPSSTVGASAVTHIAVVKNNLTSQPTYLSAAWGLSSGNAGRPLERWQSASQNRVYTSDSTATDVVSPFRSLSDRFIYCLDGQKDGVATNQHRLREFINGAQIFSITGNSSAWSTTGQKFNIGTRDDNGTQYKGNICEVLCYDKILSVADRQKIERYLAAKWGITLAPQASNADAQDWINRVYANGGSVSASTASAVNTFATSIADAGLRDRFYRLNLFCGTGLNACLVPLYRGPSLGGTQYGNTTDYNVGPFVSSDYSESGGLVAPYLSSKYLDTGLATSAIPSSVYDTMHVSGWYGYVNGYITDPYLLGASNSTVDRVALQTSIRSSALAYDSSRLGKTVSVTASTGVQGARSSTSLISSRTSSTSLVLYRNGVADATQTTAATGIAGITYPIYIFRFNSTGSVGGDMPGMSMWSYSVGDDLTSTQAAALHSALATFHSALGRA